MSKSLNGPIGPVVETPLTASELVLQWPDKGHFPAICDANKYHLSLYSTEAPPQELYPDVLV